MTSVDDLRPGAWRDAESPYAWMSVTDGEHVARILRRAAHRATGPIRVLEWGSGRSTLEFSRLLTDDNLAHHWLSLEYDRVFFDSRVAPHILERPDSVVRRIDDDTTAHGPPGNGRSVIEAVCWNRTRLRPADPEHPADRRVDLDDYVRYPATTGHTWDVILVDGRMRRRCLLTALGLLAPAGVTLLHDAWHPHYQCALAPYQASRFFGDELWAGAHDAKHLDVALHLAAGRKGHHGEHSGSPPQA